MHFLWVLDNVLQQQLSMDLEGAVYESPIHTQKMYLCNYAIHGSLDNCLIHHTHTNCCRQLTFILRPQFEQLPFYYKRP